MKKFILLVLAIILFISCQEKQQQHYFSTSPEIDETKALIKDYEDGNWKAWEGHYSDTAKVYQNTIKPATIKETQESLKKILSNVSSYKFDEKDLWYEMIIDKDGETWVNFWGIGMVHLLLMVRNW